MSNKENTAPVGPPISPFATSPCHPSEFWLKNPAWIGERPFILLTLPELITLHFKFEIDGSIDPPHFYHSHEEIEATLCTAGVSSNAYADQQAALSTPTLNHYLNVKPQGQALGEGTQAALVSPHSSITMMTLVDALNQVSAISYQSEWSTPLRQHLVLVGLP